MIGLSVRQNQDQALRGVECGAKIRFVIRSTQRQQPDVRLGGPKSEMDQPIISRRRNHIERFMKAERYYRQP